MPQIGTWIKRAVQQIVDPDRNERIAKLTDQLHLGLQNERDKFSLNAFAERVGCTDRDLGIAKRSVYRTILDRAWQDDKVTAGEQKTIDWVAERLVIHPREEKSLQQEMARNRFAAAMSQAMDDGLLESREIQRLEQIARSVGSTRGEFVRSYFRVEGETFLRGMFAACTEGGVLTTDVWNRLLKTAETLGLSKQDLVEAVHPQAVRFVEHVFADANSDGILSEDEEKNLLSLIGMLELPSESSH